MVSSFIRLQRYENESKTQNKLVYFFSAECKIPYLKVQSFFICKKYKKENECDYFLKKVAKVAKVALPIFILTIEDLTKSLRFARTLY